MLRPRLDDFALDLILRAARTQNHWLDQPVPDALLHELYELMKWGPTSANCSPARLLFVRTHEGKERLLPCMSPGNRDKTRAAPVTAIVGMDLHFYDHLPALFPHTDARAWFVGNEPLIEATAMRNSALQGAYLMIAARSLGLDCGPMSGFDAGRVNAEFFSGTNVRVNFICNLGYGDSTHLHARLPRLAFDDACRLL